IYEAGNSDEIVFDKHTQQLHVAENILYGADISSYDDYVPTYVTPVFFEQALVATLRLLSSFFETRESHANLQWSEGALRGLAKGLPRRGGRAQRSATAGGDFPPLCIKRRGYSQQSFEEETSPTLNIIILLIAKELL
ncbi:MAG: hypothetical protein II103_09020, partial [Treponema sp.]|nr:hypothetical protein [Treponema sp.]